MEDSPDTVTEEANKTLKKTTHRVQAGRRTPHIYWYLSEVSKNNHTSNKVLSTEAHDEWEEENFNTPTLRTNATT